MVRLLLFAPCERLIIGQEDQSTSLIALLTGILANVPFPPDLPLPENATVPMRWYLLSLWRCDAEDAGSTFQQRTILVSPSGRELIPADITFVLRDPSHQIVRGVVHHASFPIIEFGIHNARLLFRRTEEAEWVQAAEYPIDVVRGQTINAQPIT